MKRSLPCVLAGTALVAAAWFASPDGTAADDRATLTPAASDRPSPGVGPNAASVAPYAGVNREPILVYSVIGYGIAGPLNCSLIVYTDGTAFISEQNLLNVDGSAAEGNLDIADVMALRTDLQAAGASSLGDNSVTGADIPLTTVTFFASPFSGDKANTFNYYFPVGGQVTVTQIINAFIVEHFPGFCLLSPGIE